jgi:D-glycero-alpha-D-manno-heptose-7-phosphate kinase
MLVVRSPMRISFAGGGTDLPAYYERFGGMVVSTTINKCMYVIVTLNGQESVEITSSDYRAFFSHRPGEEVAWDGDLALPKAMMHQFGIDHGLHIFTASETPPGTGLGSSSAVAVGLAKAMSALSGLSLSRGQIAEIACHIELKKLGAPIG